MRFEHITPDYDRYEPAFQDERAKAVLEEAYERVANVVLGDLAHAHWSRPAGQDYESPIEELFGVALFAVLREEIFSTDITVSVNQKLGYYRPDVRLDWSDSHGKASVVVELDGHDYHEKTKQQATRDKKRDRYFQSKGFHVLHFTGSEIWRDPFSCAEEAIMCVFGLAYKDVSADKVEAD